MQMLAWCSTLSFLLVSAINKGTPRYREIAYGTTVDYELMKRNYPFMARLIIDGQRCGGAVIGDR